MTQRTNITGTQRINIFKTAELAKELLKKPHNVTFTNLGGVINNNLANFNPVVSGDGKILAFTTPGKQGYDIYISSFNDTVWSAPKNISPALGSGKYMKTSSLSYDGTRCCLIWKIPRIRIFISATLKKAVGQRWNPSPKKLTANGMKPMAAFRPTGKHSISQATGRAGEGDLDIYRCILQGEVWSAPQNLGPEVNTPYNEETPFVSPDNKELYFSSEGHNGMGGYDVYRYDLHDPGSVAVNLGYPVNTTENNLFYVPYGDGSTAFYAFRGEDTYGGRDIYKVKVIPDVVEEPVATVTPEIPVIENEEAMVAVETEPLATVDTIKLKTPDEAAIVPEAAANEPEAAVIVPVTAAIVTVAAAISPEAAVTETPVPEAVVIGSVAVAAEPVSVLAEPVSDVPESLAVAAEPVTVLAEPVSEPIPMEVTPEVAENLPVIPEPETLPEAVIHEPESLPTAAIPESETSKEVIAVKPVTIPGEPAATRTEEPVPVKTEISALTVETAPETGNMAGRAKSYTIQFMALKNPVDLQYFKGLSDISLTLNKDEWYRYTFLTTTDSVRADRIKRDLVSKGFTDAFIRRKPIIPRFTIQVMAVPGPVTDLKTFSNLPEITVRKDSDTFCRYTTGWFETKDDARNALAQIKSLGYTTAFVRKVKTLQ